MLKRKKMKKIIKYLAVPAAALLLSGCAGSLSTPVPGGKVVYDQKESNSYIVFSRPEFGGAALSNTIVEFDPHTYAIKSVGTLGPQTKLVYKTTPGTHYFYMDGGENDDMIKITTKQSNEYYVHTAVSVGIMVGRFYFKPIRYPSLALAESLKGGACGADTLNKYGFKAVKDDTTEITGEEKYHSTQHNINIECRKGVIKQANYNGESLSNINDATLIQPNEKAKAYYNEHRANYLKEIKEDFADWKKDDMSKTALNPEDGKVIN
jgi:hypothetical protein